MPQLAAPARPVALVPAAASAGFARRQFRARKAAGAPYVAAAPAKPQVPSRRTLPALALHLETAPSIHDACTLGREVRRGRPNPKAAPARMCR
jgi:hypothetical protein